MGQNIIELGFDVAKFKEQAQEISDELKKVFDTIVKASDTKIAPGSSGGIAELKKQIAELQAQMKLLQDANVKMAESLARVNKESKSSTEGMKGMSTAAVQLSNDLSKNIAQQLQYKNRLAEITKAVKDLKSQQDLLKNTPGNDKVKAEIEAKILAYEEERAQIKRLDAETSRFIKNQVKEMQSATGSINEQRGQLAQLEQIWDNMSDAERQSASGQDFKKKLDAIGKSVNELEQKSGRYGRNVGNYANSLASSFQKVQQEIDKLKVKQQGLVDLSQRNPIGFKLGGGEDDLNRTNAALQQLETTMQIGFKTGQTYTQTLKQMEKAQVDFGTSGLQSEEFVRQFTKELGQAKDAANDLKESLKLAASDTRGLDLMIGAAQAVAGGFAIAQGAAALFGDENEDIQKTLLKVNAVMSILNGLQAIQNELKKKDNIITISQIAAQKLYTIVVGTTTGALKALRIAMAATGIGLLVLGVGYLISKLNIFSSSSKDAAEKAKLLSDSISNQNDIIQKNIDLLSSRYDELLRMQQAELSLAEKSGKNEYTLFGIRKAIAATEKKIADDRLNAQIKLVEGMDESVNKGQKGVVALLQAQEYYKNTSVNINERIVKAEADKQEAIKKGSKALIKLADDNIAALNNEAKAATNYYNVFTDALSGAATAQTNVEAVAADEARFSADERRKLIQESAKIEANLIIASNEQILSNERSTLDQRLQAIKNISAQRREIIAADKNAILSDPSKTGADRSLAIKQAAAEEKKVTMETSKALFDEKEKYRLRDLQAENTISNTKKELVSSVNEFLSENTTLSLDQRLQAQKNYMQAQEQMARDEYKLKLAQAGISDVEIQKLLADKNYKVQVKNITDKELEALQLTHENKMLGIVVAGGDKRNQIIGEELERRKELTEEGLQDIQRVYESSELNVATNAARELMALNESYQQKKISRTKYEQERIEIENRYHAESLRNMAASLYNQLQVLGDTGAKELEAKAKLEDAKRALEVAATPEDQKAAAQKLEFAKKDYQIAKETHDKKISLEKSLVDANREASDLILKSEEDTAAKRIALFERIAAVAMQVQDVIAGAIDNRVTAEKNRIQSLIDANNAYSSAETERINNSTLAEEKKTERLIQLKAMVDAKNTQYEMKQKKADIEKAKFDKAAAITGIILNTALAITKFLSKGDVVEAVIAGVIGAAQLAVAASAPIPSYAEGTEDHPGGFARYGEDGKEKVVLPGGKSFIAEKETISWLPRHAKVIPLTKKKVDDTMYGSMIHSAADRLAEVQHAERLEKQRGDNEWKIAKWQAEQNRAAIEANRVKQSIHVHNHIDLDHAEWVNKNVFGR